MLILQSGWNAAWFWHTLSHVKPWAGCLQICLPTRQVLHADKQCGAAFAHAAEIQELTYVR